MKLLKHFNKEFFGTFVVRCILDFEVELRGHDTVPPTSVLSDAADSELVNIRTGKPRG